MTDRNLRVKISLDTAALRAETAQAADAFDKIGKSAKAAGSTAQKAVKDSAADAEQSGSRIGSSFTSGYGKATDAAGLAAKAGTYVGLAVAGGAVMAGKAILDIGISYEKQMNTLQAVTGASDATMKQVSDTATALGNAIDIPGASAADAAQAMTELAKGGFDVQQAMTAARGTLQLAAAAQISGAEAAQIQATAMNAFSLQADQAGHVADVLANVANAASGSIGDFAAGMQQSAGVAASFGISIDDSATVLGLFAKNGMLGSDAGTSFKTSLIALASPTVQQAKALDDLGIKVYDAQGKFVGMKAITEELSAASKTMTQEQFNLATSTAFGSDAMRAAGFLAKEGGKGYDDMRVAVTKAGGAQELAAAQTKGVTGAWNALTNTLETGAIGAFQALAPVMADVLSAGNALIGMVQAIPGPAWAIAGAFGAVAVLKSPVVSMFTGIGAALKGVNENMLTVQARAAMSGHEISKLGVGMKVAGSAAKEMGSSLSSALGGPIGIAVIAGTTILALAGDIGKIKVETNDFSGAIDTLTGKIKGLDAIKGIIKPEELLNMQAAGVAVGDYTLALSGNEPAQKRVTDALSAHVLATKDDINANHDALTLMTQWQNDLGGLEAAQKGNTAATLEATTATHKAAMEVGTASIQHQALNDNLSLYGTNGQVATAALQSVADAAKYAGPPVTTLGGAWDDGAISASEFTTQVDNVMLALDLLAGRNGNAEAAQRAFNQQVRDYGQAGIAQAKEAVDFNRLLQDQKTATDDLAAAKDKALSKSYTEADRAKAVEAATRRVEDANNSLAVATVNTGKAADDTAQKTDDLKRSYIEAGQRAFDAAIQQGNYAGATDAATKALEAAKQGFINMQPEADKASGKAQAVADALFGIPAERATTIVASDAASPVIDAINKKKIDDKFFAITAQLKTSGTLGAGLAGVMSTIVGSIPKADGGIVQAANGLDRQSMIAPGGSNILWAEPETGWEAYISGKPSQLQRNRGILSETASRLGMGVYDIAPGNNYSGNDYSSSVTHNVFSAAPSSSASASAAPAVHKYFPITIVNQGAPMTGDRLLEIQRDRERLDL